jgi:cytochrome c-type biogenesis protein
MDLNGITLPLAFAAGLASFLSPCVLPLVPAYLAYLARPIGQTAAVTAAGGRTIAESSQTVLSGIAFVVGLSIVFVTFFYALQVVLLPVRTWVSLVGGVLVILFGLHTAGLLRLPFVSSEFRLMEKAPAQTGPLGGLLLGVGFAAGWTPCIGITLGAVISSGIARGTTLQGLGLMLAYCLGLGLPFVAMSLGIDRALSLIRTLGRRRRAIDLGSGAVLVTMGLLLMTNNLLLLTQALNRMIPYAPFGL